MKTVAAFDFDGIITKKDTLLEFIKFAKGSKAFYIGMLLHSPILMAYKLKLYPNWKAKQHIFTYFFQGMPLVDFNRVCEQFFAKEGESLLYNSAVQQIEAHLDKLDEVVIVSASVENWVQPFARYLGVKHVLSTRLEINEQGKLTGRFATSNCYGQEKVNRLAALFPERQKYHLIAYGDSRGDKELLASADEQYYKLFQK
ncbi:MAG: HAD-IB family hydrolase [Bacteroides sp.]|nr:HAD-IB family hydrolase [Bacteroides sp.]